jgi:3-methyladenine DNA glycosylase/8-oxoguanine DNA glycosylase
VGAVGTIGAVDETALSTVWDPAVPVDLRLVLSQLGRGAGDPTLLWDPVGRYGPAGVWRSLRTPQGPATLHLAQTARGAVHARAWGAGAEWTIAGVPELLGAGDDPSGLDLSSSPALAEAARRLPGLRLARVGLVFEMLLAAILEQKVTVKEAHAAWRQLIRRHGETPPGPAPDGMRVFPEAAVWRRIPSWEWHRAGVDPRRSRTCVEAAKVASSLERTLELGRGGPEVHARLRSLGGVGIWTAAETSQRAHGDADEVSVGDYHLHDIVGWALTGGPVDDDGMLELLEPWRGHRQRVVRIILASGFRKPRFGPKMTIQDHRRH